MLVGRGVVERERGGGGETERGEEREGVIEKREREAKPVVRLGRLHSVF